MALTRKPFGPFIKRYYIDLKDKETLHEAKRRQKRSTRKLVFDCVNAVLVDIVGYGSDGSQRVMANTIVEEVWAQMNAWFCRECVYDDCGDENTLVVERVVRKEVVGKGWNGNLTLEIDNLGKEIEGKLLEELVEETVVELTEVLPDVDGNVNGTDANKTQPNPNSWSTGKLRQTWQREAEPRPFYTGEGEKDDWEEVMDQMASTDEEPFPWPNINFPREDMEEASKQYKRALIVKYNDVGVNNDTPKDAPKTTRQMPKTDGNTGDANSAQSPDEYGPWMLVQGRDRRPAKNQTVGTAAQSKEKNRVNLGKENPPTKSIFKAGGQDTYEWKEKEKSAFQVRKDNIQKGKIINGGQAKKKSDTTSSESSLGSKFSVLEDELVDLDSPAQLDPSSRIKMNDSIVAQAQTKEIGTLQKEKASLAHLASSPTLASPQDQPMPNKVELRDPPAELEKAKHKLKRLVPTPNSFFMDVKCLGLFKHNYCF
ncbi:hypothetical protein BUALT_Bualt13G0026900 [Buddleja alternifolia]|uniref:DUF4378 domain-containing protein n=1 Tax=Buddleja alternifolia TaxID=168488 RepID=A0AAV6WIA0_9LAMI|nr:hypothetical protein BUALT_Bualt13G0026900 [Buddleja alternifolia]